MRELEWTNKIYDSLKIWMDALTSRAELVAPDFKHLLFDETAETFMAVGAILAPKNRMEISTPSKFSAGP